jgi:hypothetical protein
VTSLKEIQWYIIHETKDVRFYSYGYLVCILMFYAYSNSASGHTYGFVYLAIYMLCIIIASHYRIRDCMDTERIKKSCIAIAIAIEFWAIQIFYLNYKIPAYFIFILCIAFPGGLYIVSRSRYDARNLFLDFLRYYSELI